MFVFWPFSRRHFSFHKISTVHFPSFIMFTATSCYQSKIISPLLLVFPNIILNPKISFDQLVVHFWCDLITKSTFYLIFLSISCHSILLSLWFWSLYVSFWSYLLGAEGKFDGDLVTSLPLSFSSLTNAFCWYLVPNMQQWSDPLLPPVYSLVSSAAVFQNLGEWNCANRNNCNSFLCAVHSPSIFYFVSFIQLRSYRALVYNPGPF